MRLIAFVPGRPKPQPRVTQSVKFLFGHTVEHWKRVDAENADKAANGLLNKKGKPYKPTRYAYRLERLQAINAYRDRVRETVKRSNKMGIPTQNLFFFYLFHAPASWSKKKRREVYWQFHVKKPDYSNLLKGVEDCLYTSDSECNAVANYKIYVPEEFSEGLLILQDEEIHKYVVQTAVDAFIKKLSICSAGHT